jgi:hypothetical protein
MTVTYHKYADAPNHAVSPSCRSSKKKILPPLAGNHDPTLNNGDRHYCARPETDLKKIKENRKKSTVKTATPVECSEVIHY